MYPAYSIDIILPIDDSAVVQPFAHSAPFFRPLDEPARRLEERTGPINMTVSESLLRAFESKA